MKYKSLAKEIVAMKDADLVMRESLIQRGVLGEGYHPEMEQLHYNNADRLETIIDRIGYPTVDQVGPAASEAAWLVIQHSIGRPDFMRKCATLLAKAVGEQRANPVNLAYLSDRIAVFEGRSQLYGTQFDWDEDGEMRPQAYDDLSAVNRRRKSIGLNTLEEQTELLSRRTEQENERPPEDWGKRQKEMTDWRRKVGWI